jgi:ActR/RegA family two-component response regulator
LVVDDDVGFLDSATRAMPDREVVVSGQPELARARCRAEPFDLVITDLWFGQVPADFLRDGIQLAMALRAEFPQLHVAVVSAGLDVSAALVVRRKLPDDVLVYPKGATVFTRILRELEEADVSDEDIMSAPLQSFDEIKAEHARRALARSANNRSEAARRLLVNRSTLVRALELGNDDGWNDNTSVVDEHTPEHIHPRGSGPTRRLCDVE